MNPIWILVGLGLLWLVAVMAADDYDDRRAAAGDDWRGDLREELSALGHAFIRLPLLPLALVVGTGGEVLLAGGPTWWWRGLAGSVIWLGVLAWLWREAEPRAPSGDAPIGAVLDATWRDPRQSRPRPPGDGPPDPGSAS